MTKRICVIGSSYIGAVYTAYKVHGSEDDQFQIDFFGHSHGGFPNVKIVNGHVRNVRFKSPGTSVDVREYDAFVVYGDLPAPHDLAKRVNHCMQKSASQQLTKTLVADVVRATTAYSLADALLQVTGKPVLMLSQNVVVISKTKMKETLNAYIISLFETALYPLTSTCRFRVKSSANSSSLTSNITKVQSTLPATRRRKTPGTTIII